MFRHNTILRVAITAAMLCAGCDKAQSIIDDVQKKANESMASNPPPAEATKTTVDPADPSSAEGSANVKPMEPIVNPMGQSAPDDAAIIALWNRTPIPERSDSSIANLLNASPESLKEINAFNFRAAGSNLTAAGLKLLRKFPLVKTVDISLHRLSVDQMEALCDLPELEDLNLFSTELDDAMAQPLKHASKLRNLNVSGNLGLTDGGLQAIHNLVELQSLYMDTTNAAGAFLDKAKFLGGLKRFSAESSIKFQALAALKGAANLEYLGISMTQTSDQQLKFINNLGKLREVYMRTNTNISDVGVAFLNGNPNLEVLDIRETSVAGAGLKFLLTAKKLRLLKTQQSRVDGATLAALRKAHPNATIE